MDVVRGAAWHRPWLCLVALSMLPGVTGMRAGVQSASAGGNHHEWWTKYRQMQRTAAQIVRADANRPSGASAVPLSELPLVYPVFTGGPNNQLIQLLTTALVTRTSGGALISPEVILQYALCKTPYLRLAGRFG